MDLGNSEMNLNVDLRSLDTIKCPSCTNKLFRQDFVLKRVPKMMVGAPTDIPVPIPIWRCESCGEILKDFIPRGVGSFDELFGEKKIIDDGK